MQKISRRRLGTLFGAAMIMAHGATLGPAASAEYPKQSVRVLLPHAAGSMVDLVARLVTDKMAQDLGQTFVVENVASAAGVVAMEQLIRSPNDGYTISFISTNHVVFPLLKDLPYDLMNDTTQISFATSSPMVIVASPNLEESTLADLVERAKSEPGSVSYGSNGVGSLNHIAGESLAAATGTDLLHVPFAANDRFTSDLMGGHIDIGILPTANMTPLIRGGQVRPLAVLEPERVTSLPDVPTARELGIDVDRIDVWVAMIGPANLPQDVVAKLQTSLQSALQSPDVVEKLSASTLIPTPTTPEETSQRFRADQETFRKIIEARNIQAE